MIGISETGARLIFRTKKEIPDLFTIDMPGHGRRKCRVVWRGEMDIGMAFEPVKPRRARKPAHTTVDRLATPAEDANLRSEGVQATGNVMAGLRATLG
jgi:hypothetical protein